MLRRPITLCFALAAAVLSACAPDRPGPRPARASAEAVDLDPESAAGLLEGRRLYLTYGCGSCHGLEGRGDGPAAVATRVPPRDLRRPTAFRHGRSIDEIARTIAAGVPESGDAMPPSPYIDLADRRRIAAYVRSLAEEE